MKGRVTIIGGGIQGCCVALKLAQLGFEVTIVEQDGKLMNRASVNNEGKIHLGFVYGLDKSLNTAKSMIESALHFAPIIESLVEQKLDWDNHVSTPFFYARHSESDMSAEQLTEYFESIQTIYEEAIGNKELHYLGQRPTQLWEETRQSAILNGEITHAFATEELAIDTHWLRKVLVSAIDRNSRISVTLDAHVENIVKSNGQWRVSWLNGDAHQIIDSEVLVNCSWENRTRIDDNVFERPITDEFLTRIKYGFILKTAEKSKELPSITVVHGPFGDIVNFVNSDRLYMSWYPDAMVMKTNNNQIDILDELRCRGEFPEGEANEIYFANLKAFEKIVGELSMLERVEVRVGAILGRAKTDIDDLNSGLHRRISSVECLAENYYSIFTGKYTCAPLNVVKLMETMNLYTHSD